VEDSQARDRNDSYAWPLKGSVQDFFDGNGRVLGRERERRFFFLWHFQKNAENRTVLLVKQDSMTHFFHELAKFGGVQSTLKRHLKER